MLAKAKHSHVWEQANSIGRNWAKKEERIAGRKEKKEREESTHAMQECESKKKMRKFQRSFKLTFSK